MRVNEVTWGRPGSEGASAWLQLEELEWLVVVEFNAALWNLVEVLPMRF